MRDDNYEVVVGIDFGSSGSGYAFSFFDNNKICYCDMPGVDINKKMPTEIILDGKNEVVAFGAKCKDYLKEKGLHQGNYFKGIKMHLYERKKEIKACNSDKVLPLELVIQKVLEKLKDLCVEQLQKSWKIEESNIKWVVTVPAIWGEIEKDIMMKACENIGLISENDNKSLFFALEPEAASYYCSREGNLDKIYMLEGNVYIVCDLGGGTGDIVAHYVKGNNNLDEISIPCGGPFGSNEIDKKIFNEIIKKIFECDNFNSFLKKYNELLEKEEEDESTLYDEWNRLEEDIKSFKEASTLEKIRNDEKYPISCTVFQYIFNDENINDLIDKYNKPLQNDSLKLTVKSKKKWIIDFPFKIIDKYIGEQVNKLCKEIKEMKFSIKEEANTLIFVGGYCSNEVLISKIKNNLGEKYNYVQPNNSSLAIMEGALLFGLNPGIIHTRLAKYTLGTDVYDVWNDEIHSKGGEKIFDEDDQKWYCKDTFDKFIEVGQKLNYDESLPPHSFIMLGPRTLNLQFYKSLKPNPIFISEKGVEKIMECELDAKKDYPVSERELKVYMYCGGTSIDIKAVHVKSGIQISTNIKYE